MNILIGLVLLLVPFSEDTHGLLIKDDLVILVIDHKTTTEELDGYKKKLQEDFNISLEYQLKFDKEDKLKWINLSVDCNDGVSGSFKTPIKSISENVGFYRIFKTDVTTPFAVGYMPDMYGLKK